MRNYNPETGDFYNPEPEKDQTVYAVGNRDPNSDTYASDTWADITRSQWDDYENRFVPKEDDLIEMLTYDNLGLVKTAVSDAKKAAGQSFDAINKMTDQYRSRYGMAMSAGSGAVQARNAQLDKTATQVQAANQARQDLQNRNREIALGMGNAATTAAGGYA